MKNNQLASSRSVCMRDINAILSAPISRMGGRPQGRDDKGRRGFTLIELLVVVLIIGILAAIAVPQYQKAVEKSRGIEAISLLRTLYNAQQAYYLVNGKYPESFSELDIGVTCKGTPTPKNAFLMSIRGSCLVSDNWAAYLGGSAIIIERQTGKYAGCLFLIYSSNPLARPGAIVCAEPGTDSSTYQRSKEGYYCQKLYSATYLHRNKNAVEFTMS